MKSFEEAATASRFNKAVSVAEKIEHKGRMVYAEIIKPREGDGWWVWAGTGVKIRRALAREIDRVSQWKPY